MIRSRTVKRIKKGTPGGKMTIHYRKTSKKSLLKSQPKIKRELLKARVRK